MKKYLSFLFLSALLPLATSCISDEPYFSTEVVRIENSTVSYYDTDYHHWYCREALIYVSHEPRHVMFPEQYEGEIESGTKVDWSCHTVTAYYRNGKKISIDWEGTKL